jgi:hypothetical protein
LTLREGEQQYSFVSADFGSAGRKHGQADFDGWL